MSRAVESAIAKRERIARGEPEKVKRSHAKKEPAVEPQVEEGPAVSEGQEAAEAVEEVSGAEGSP